jgi:hypothetical protein
MRGYVRLGELTTILVIYMKIKSYGKLLGCNSLSGAIYRNPGMLLNGQGSDRHLFGDTSYLDLDTLLSE